MVHVKQEDWNRKHAEAGLLFGAEPNRFLVAEVEGLAPGRALDLACGAGRNAVWLAQRGWAVTGVDFSDVALANARRLAADRGVEVEWVLADLREWSPAGETFDLVAVLYLQLPAEERRGVLGRAAHAVAPGGTLLVVGHDLQNLNGGYGGPKDPAVLFTAEDVAAELTGLQVEKAERVLRPVETEEGEAQAIDALVRARRAQEGPRRVS
jgi:2-polyprenyl-3-methyl-5-hydroxy-6-metoxy-1,4-benzoquinol methylase